MQAFSVLMVLGILARWSCSAVFLNHRPFPTYSLEDMPSTQFTCREKILGGYYADSETQCQMFHVCVKVAGIGVQDFRFLCPNGTAFDQDHQICADWEDVDCDATTLYYSSDNFDLYRIGSGFESKAHRYGEDEETFALQRAETGDARINRERQTQVVNQQKEYQKPQPRRNNNNNSNQERDIFKTSSSSNFFNNRNNGKETDEDYDDNVNVNQHRDYHQRRKVIRKQHRRPVEQNDDQSFNSNRNINNKQTEQEIQKTSEVQTRRPQRPTGFANNFAASSYIPTTPRSSSTTVNNDQYTTSSNINNNFRRGQSERVSDDGSYTPTSENNNSPTATYTISTPAPFRQSFAASQTTNQINNAQYRTSSTENYPSNNPLYYKTTAGFVSSQYNTAFDKKPTSPKKVEKSTTFSPNAKPFSILNNQPFSQGGTSLPTTFAPRTQQAYTQIAQQTNTYNNNYNTRETQNPSTFGQPSSSPSTTQRSTTFTQYTPTVPKITSTTPASKSVRFDETQYDDGSYNSRYDNNANEDEFLKTAHSQNIASSRNEFAKIQKQQQQSPVTTQKPYEFPKTFKTTTNAPRQTENYSKSSPLSTITRNTQVTQRSIETKQSETTPQPVSKKVKSVSYDYAYYDSVGPESDYQLDTDIKKSNVKN